MIVTQDVTLVGVETPEYTESVSGRNRVLEQGW